MIENTVRNLYGKNRARAWLSLKTGGSSSIPVISRCISTASSKDSIGM